MICRVRQVIVAALLVLSFPSFGKQIVFLEPEGTKGGFAQFAAQVSKVVRSRHADVVLKHRYIAVTDISTARYQLAEIEAPHVLVTAHTLIAQAAVLQFPDIPIVVATLADPAQLGLTSSTTQRPNVTGFTFHHEFELKHFEFLRELDPRIQRVGVIVDRHWRTEALSRRIVEQGPALVGIEVEVFSAEEGGDPLEWSKSPSAARMDAWFVPDTPTNRIHGAAIAREVRRLKRPSIGGHRSHAIGGGLMVYEPDRVDPWPRIARIVNLVLSGVPARDIAFDRPSTFRLVVNLKAAAELGIAMPVSLTRRADEVIR